MPKINSAGVPSYDGHQGEVTNAVGEQFNVDPTRDLNGEHAEGYESKPVEEFEETPAPGVAGPITELTGDEDDEERDDTDESGDRRQAGRGPRQRRDDLSALKLGDEKQGEPAAGSPKKVTPPSAAKHGEGTDSQKK